MKLYECEGKMVFAKAGIPIPRGNVIASVDEAAASAATLGYPVVLKIQVMSGGRGKAGGVKLVSNESILRETASQLLQMSHGGEQVERLLVEQQLNIKYEYYAGITLDPLTLLPLLMFSTQGGMDIEHVAETMPEKIITRHLDPLKAMPLHGVLEMLEESGIDNGHLMPVTKIIMGLIKAYYAYDAITAEINPLVIMDDGKALAADAKFETDDSAHYRLKSVLGIVREEQGMTQLERKAKELDLAYVSLDGTVGLICGGAGIGMGSMDMVMAHGGRAANFLDLGGNATTEKTAAALRLVLGDPAVKGVLMNVFGGINNCATMAKGVCEVLDETPLRCALVVKMRGHSQDEGWAMLEQRGIPLVKLGTTAEAVGLLMHEISRTKEQ